MTDDAYKIVAALEKMLENAEDLFDTEEPYSNGYLRALREAHSKALSIAEGF